MNIETKLKLLVSILKEAHNCLDACLEFNAGAGPRHNNLYRVTCFSYRLRLTLLDNRARNARRGVAASAKALAILLS